MFAFNLPKFAALQVSLPTGGGALMVHVGGGRFLSRIPPIALAGVMPASEVAQNQEGLPVDWDGATLPALGDGQPVYFAFDVAAAQRGVEEAARLGDPFAKMLMVEIEAAQRTLDARAALGVMDAAPDAAAYVIPAADADPVDAAVDAGAGSGA